MLRSHPARRARALSRAPRPPGSRVATRQMRDSAAWCRSRCTVARMAALASLQRTEVFTLAESLGAVESLIEHPGAMTHASVAGSPLAGRPALVRLSVGHRDDRRPGRRPPRRARRVRRRAAQTPALGLGVDGGRVGADKITPEQTPTEEESNEPQASFRSSSSRRLRHDEVERLLPGFRSRAPPTSAHRSAATKCSDPNDHSPTRMVTIIESPVVRRTAMQNWPLPETGPSSPTRWASCPTGPAHFPRPRPDPKPRGLDGAPHNCSVRAIRAL